jgi:hypothetical protein
MHAWLAIGSMLTRTRSSWQESGVAIRQASSTSSMKRVPAQNQAVTRFHSVMSLRRLSTDVTAALKAVSRADKLNGGVAAALGIGKRIADVLPNSGQRSRQGNEPVGEPKGFADVVGNEQHGGRALAQ